MISVEFFPAPCGDHSCWMWILFMINVELFPVDKFLSDQKVICVEGFSVDNLRILSHCPLKSTRLSVI